MAVLWGGTVDACFRHVQRCGERFGNDFRAIRRILDDFNPDFVLVWGDDVDFTDLLGTPSPAEHRVALLAQDRAERQTHTFRTPPACPQGQRQA